MEARELRGGRGRLRPSREEGAEVGVLEARRHAPQRKARCRVAPRRRERRAEPRARPALVGLGLRLGLALGLALGLGLTLGLGSYG